MTQNPSIASYSMLGRSGLRVSPLCLGTMTFGTEWGWGSEESAARAIWNRYLEAGGNFVDTADGYTGGKSEELVGKFLGESKNRDRVVLATKFTFNAEPGNPNAGGNGRKNIARALEGSLRRMKTDYVDLYWLHAWDMVTPIEEVISTLDTLVTQGKVRYIGLSNTPSWYLARMQTIAELRGYEKLIALQLEYSLVERSIEREHVPAALELGMGICGWSPLASGLLSGKYTRQGSSGDGRLDKTKDSPNPLMQRYSERNWKIVDALIGVSKELGKPPAQVALNFITKRPGVSSTILGATKIAQLDDNLAALDFELPAPLAAKLDEASKPDLGQPYTFFAPPMQSMISGGTKVQREPSWFRGR